MVSQKVRRTNLVDKLTTVDVLAGKNLRPKLGLATLDEVPSLLLKHRILVRDSNELLIAEALCIRDIRQVRVALLTEFTNNQRLVELDKTTR